MEANPLLDLTLAQLRTLLSEFGREHGGSVRQSYFYRSEADRAALDDLHPNLRIVKGAYLEPETVAMPVKADVDASYRKLVYAHMKAGNYVNVATHDESIIRDVQHFVLANGISKDAFE